MTQSISTTISALSGSFGKYRPIAELGRGGMATVYLAAASGPGGFTKLVVIKEIKPELAEDPEFLAMFLDEAKLAARLSHPNIVQTFEVQESGNRHAIVMEYLDGQPLSRVRSKVADLGEYGTAVQLRVIADALAGLHHAHELVDYDGTPLNVVHRDVSPHNVFVTYAGQAKVVDFGIAKAADTSSQTRVGVIKGKLSYMSPEQAMSDPSVRVDRRADVFAAGIMIWEAVAGQRLWKGLEEFAIMHRLATGEIPRLRDIKPDVAPLIDQICARALAIKPENRYPTAEALRQDLELYIASCAIKPSAHEVGERIAAAFDADRRKIRGVIEQQLRAIRQPDAAHERPLPQLGPHHTGTPSASASALSAHAAMVTPPSGTTLPQPSRSGAWFALVGVGAAIGAGAVILMVARVKQNSAGDPPPPKIMTTQTATALPSAEAPKKIHITVSAKPDKAKMTLDGKPFDGTIDAPQDGSEHELKVEAVGYAPDTRKIKFDRDQAIPVILEAKKGVKVPAATTVKPQSDGDELGF
jgi:serine/threonine-protein kinase